MPTETVTNSLSFQHAVAAMPDGLPWFSAGVFFALWAFYPWEEKSRLQQLWSSLTRKFDVEKVHVGKWTDDFVSIMPQSDAGVRLKIKFRKTLRPARFRLRIIQMSGMRKPTEKIIDLSRDEIVSGEVLNIPLVTAGEASPGWDPSLPRGWGPHQDGHIIVDAPNILIVECEGRLHTQKHRFFIQRLKTGDNNGPHPAFFVLDEDHEPFDPDAPFGMWAYD